MTITKDERKQLHSHFESHRDLQLVKPMLPTASIWTNLPLWFLLSNSSLSWVARTLGGAVIYNQQRFVCVSVNIYSIKRFSKAQSVLCVCVQYVLYVCGMYIVCLCMCVVCTWCVCVCVCVCSPGSCGGGGGRQQAQQDPPDVGLLSWLCPSGCVCQPQPPTTALCVCVCVFKRNHNDRQGSCSERTHSHVESKTAAERLQDEEFNISCGLVLASLWKSSLS